MRFSALMAGGSKLLYSRARGSDTLLQPPWASAHILNTRHLFFFLFKKPWFILLLISLGLNIKFWVKISLLELSPLFTK